VGPPKVVPILSCCLATRHVEKFREVIPLDTDVSRANAMNFKPILGFSLLEIVGSGTPSLVRCGLGSLYHSLACVRIRGGSSG